MPLTQSQVLNSRYRIVNLIGQGGFGAVYRAWDLNLKRPCAIKENLDASPQAQQQFDREVQLLANLHHSNLPRIYDYFFLPDQGQYLVMDFIEGQNLQAMLSERGPLPEDEVIPWIQQICAALDYMHAQTPPVIHRDIKPANIIITPQGRAILVDFGISKIYDPHLKTTVGARAITPGYSPWEQYGQGTTDNRSDLYALGATLYNLLTGQEPPESIALMGGTAELKPPRQINQSITPFVAQAIEKTMQTRPTDRIASAAELAQALLPPMPAPEKTAAAPDTTPVIPPQKSRPMWVWGVVVLVVVSAAVGLGYALGNTNGREDDPASAVVVEAAAGSQASDSVGQADEPEAAAPAEVDDAAEQSAGPQLGDTRIRPQDGMVMVYVPPPAAPFELGSGLAAPTEGYWIDKYEVSNAQYQLCVDAGICEPSDFADNDDFNGDAFPVVGVSWSDAAAYSEWVGGALPTEAEWEYAAAGETGTIYPWGDEFDGTRLNFCDTNCAYPQKDENWNDGYVRTALVGSYPTGESWVGAADMAGNVWEWTNAWFGTTQNRRVLKGGSWRDDSYFMKVDAHSGSNPDNRSGNFGFRVVMADPLSP